MQSTDILFYVTATVAVAATALAITRARAVHALLYLIVSLLALALVFFLLGSPLVAALEIIIYAGAIMVLFVFVIMMLNLGPGSGAEEGRTLAPRFWIGPGLLGGWLMLELLWLALRAKPSRLAVQVVGPAEVGQSLFGPYLAAVVLVGLLLVAGLVGAFHLGRRAVIAGRSGKGVP